MSEIAYYLLMAMAAFWVIKKIFIRIQLSRAKHSSLRGHAKWSRRIARQIPMFEYSEQEFYDIDGAPSDVRQSRIQGFCQLQQKLSDRSPKSIAFYQELQHEISDVDFTNAYRAPFPFRKIVNKYLKPSSILVQSKGVEVQDMDNNWSIDASGSYGVNVFGYDFYKQCMQDGMEKTKDLGPVLGTYHPLIAENVRMIKNISGLDEVSFHMSGTEAVMQAVRLARYHTGKTHLVRFCGAYHGWWDGVQPGIGNQRKTQDVYTLADLSKHSLRVLRTRKDIACVLINPFQAMHPNADAAGDASLVNSDRKTHFDKIAYTTWLHEIRKICSERSIVLIMDEVFSGFRLGYRGAQEFFDIQADIVTYGKTIGGGLPIGVVCGTHELMKRYRDDRPVDFSFARGTFNSHPTVMACMNEFLNRIQSEDIQSIYQKAEMTWNARTEDLNKQLERKPLPLRVENMHSVLTIIYKRPSRYNWLFQYYLRAEGITLGWTGSGRLIMSLNFTDEDFKRFIERFIAAAKKMEAAGWWYVTPGLSNQSIKSDIFKSMLATRFPWLKRFTNSAVSQSTHDDLKEVRTND